MGPEVPLRIAGPADIASVSSLVAGFRDFLGSDEPKNAEIEAVVSVLLKDRSTEFLLIGEPDEGFAQLRFRLSVWTGSEDAWLEDVFVQESVRGKGFGRRLVEGAIARAQARGCARLQLDANRENLPAISLYESLGFRPIHNPAKWGDAPDYFFTLELS